jgi:hypothetical protein
MIDLDGKPGDEDHCDNATSHRPFPSKRFWRKNDRGPRISPLLINSLKGSHFETVAEIQKVTTAVRNDAGIHVQLQEGSAQNKM